MIRATAPRIGVFGIGLDGLDQGFQGPGAAVDVTNWY